MPGAESGGFRGRDHGTARGGGGRSHLILGVCPVSYEADERDRTGKTSGGEATITAGCGPVQTEPCHGDG